MVPTALLSDQVTAVFADPRIVAVNCWVCPAIKVEVRGLTVTLTGKSVMITLANFVVSAAEVALIVRVRWLPIKLGAV